MTEHQHSWSCEGCGAVLMEMQPRESNGRYGVKPQAEVEVDLSPPALRGSFLFPPVFESAEQVIEFFENVQIPDDVLVKLSSNYASTYTLTGSTEAGDTADAWWETAELPYRQRNGGDTSDEARAVYTAQLEKSWSNRPEYLSGADARVAAKVVGMLENARNMDRAQKDTVGAHLINTSTGMVPVREFDRDLGLRHLSAAVTNPVSYDTDAQVSELRVELANTRMQLADTSSQLEDQIRETRDSFSQRIESTRTDMLDAIEIVL